MNNIVFLRSNRLQLQKTQEIQWNQFFLFKSLFEKIIHFCWSNRLQTLHDHSSGVASLPEWFFLPNFSAWKIYLKLLLIWPGLEVFPFKMMKKEACRRFQHVNISRNRPSRFVGRLWACLKNQTFERQWKMCSTGLNACNLGYGGSVHVHESAIVVMANMANTRKTVQVVRWSSRKRRVAQAYWTRATGEMIFPGPRFPQKSPQMGEGQFFPPLPQKLPNLFHWENKRHLNLLLSRTTKTNNYW